MRKIIIAAIASAVAVLSIAGTASASVKVDEAGNGFVGKGDVQTALGLANDAAMQDLFKNGQIKFTSSTTRTTDNVWSCTNGVGEQHSYRVTVMDRPIGAAANTNGAGKLTNGWNLTGIGAAPYAVKSDTGIPAGTATCPAGSSLDFTKPLSINQIGVAKYTTYTYGGLEVNGIALPNTPVEVAPVA